MAKKFIVITSIFPPTEAVKLFAKQPGWQLIVVGDKKSPPDWKWPGVIYLGPDDQEKLGFEILSHLPWNHYCRKMVGYLYALRHGAEVIYDTDDDNLPKPGWPALPSNRGKYKTLSGQKFINIYNHYSDEFIWPRGFPLAHVRQASQPSESLENHEVGVWQFLADEDPDVDAIFRLTIDKQVRFKDKPPVVLASGSVCPINSQNTVFAKKLFPLLYLPAFVTFRFTDILRGLVAQPLLWKHDYRLGFGPANLLQERNPHNLMLDFKQEVPVYLHSEEVVDTVIATLKKAKSQDLGGRLLEVYEALKDNEIVTEEEIKLLSAWLSDVKQISGRRA